MNQYRQVSKEEYEKFLSEYPNKLETNYTQICEPPMLSHNDFTGGKVWPESIVAKKHFEWYGDPSEYFIRES